MKTSKSEMEAGVQQEVDALCLGTKIRTLRQRRNLTLQEVSDISGLSKSLLSQIENETSAPPIPTLVRIARALGVKIGYFFREPQHLQQISVVRKDDRQEQVKLPHNRPEQSGYRYVPLALPIIDQHMEPFWVRFEPGTNKDADYYQHSGEEFVYVLEGELEFLTEGQKIAIHPGDSLYFKSSIPHMVRNLGRSPASAVAVIYGTNE